MGDSAFMEVLRNRDGSVTVVMMLFRTLTDWNHASMRNFAHHVLKLDRRVLDAEIMMQPFFHIPQNALAHGRRNIRDRNVA